MVVLAGGARGVEKGLGGFTIRGTAKIVQEVREC